MIRVLFVCLGNICRSPMGEAVFADKVRQAGLSDAITVDSAGTGGWHAGEPAHEGTRAVLQRVGIPYDGQARQVKRSDFDTFDYIVVMDRENLSAMRHYGQASRAEVSLFLRWAKAAGTVTTDEVPDPYYDNTFDRVYDLVTKGADALLAHIRAEHSL